MKLVEKRAIINLNTCYFLVDLVDSLLTLSLAHVTFQLCKQARRHIGREEYFAYSTWFIAQCGTAFSAFCTLCDLQSSIEVNWLGQGRAFPGHHICTISALPTKPSSQTSVCSFVCEGARLQTSTRFLIHLSHLLRLPSPCPICKPWPGQGRQQQQPTQDREDSSNSPCGTLHQERPRKYRLSVFTECL